MSPRTSALIQANIVTLIWSASWVFIKIGLQDIPPLTFAGLRYFIAFLCLLFLVTRSGKYRAAVAALEPREWRSLLLLGVFGYAIAQGAQFVALVYLPSATLSLMLNFTTVLVVLFSILWLKEAPTRAQYVGIGLFLTGVLIYFLPVDLPLEQWIGLGVAVVCVSANATGSVIGRSVNRRANISPLIVTTVAMGAGSSLMLGGALVTEGIPDITPRAGLIILWLAVVHTALTFVMWNNTMRVLTAPESSLINNLMMVEIAILAWIFLGEAISPKGIIGLVLAFSGIVIAQLGGAAYRRAKRHMRG